MKSFVVRIPDEGDASGSLRGVVDDVSTGERTTFRDARELLAVLAAGVVGAGQAGAGPGAEAKSGSVEPASTEGRER